MAVPPPGRGAGDAPWVPPGFSPAPTGASYGAPAPPPKKDNTGTAVAIGCGGLLALLFLGPCVAGFVAAVSKPRRRGATTYPMPPPPPPAPPPTSSGEPSAEGRVELRDLRFVREGERRFFVGELYNVSTEPVGSPSARLELFGAGNEKLDEGLCSLPFRVLAPGDKVPCTATLYKGGDSPRVEAKAEALGQWFSGTVVELETRDVKFKRRKSGPEPWTLEGTLENPSASRATSVAAIVALYDADKKIVAATYAPAERNELEPAASAPFRAYFFRVVAEPASYRVQAVGYVE